MIDAFKERRQLMLKLISEIPGIKANEPDGAFYVFPDISYYFGKTLNNKFIKDASDFALYLLEEANVATVTGAAFGDPNCIRISYAAADKDIIEAMRRIKEALA
jgi:aspartate aminotransferase